MSDPSLETLYRHHHSWLRAVLYRRSGCSELAADLAQDTFARLLREIDDSATEVEKLLDLRPIITENREVGVRFHQHYFSRHF